MSGLEIAGVVLGSIPLLISGLEHYAEGATTIKRMFRAPGEFRSLSRRLRVEHDIFRNAMELLLSDCVDDLALQNLLDNVGGDSWCEAGINAALRRKLSKSYTVYMETVEDMNKTLLVFRQRLRIGDDGKGPFNDPNSFKEAWKRFKFGIKKADYMDLIDEISKDNSALQKLTEQSVALEPARTTRKRIPNFTKIRGHASSMFSTLQSGLRGSCQASHRASLYMRPLELEASPLPGFEEHAFRVVLHHDLKAPPQLPSQWMTEEAEVRMLDAMIVSNNVTTTIASPTSILPKGKKSLRWQDPPKPTTESGIPKVPTQQQALNEIKDLCKGIQQLRTSKCGSCIGYLQDQGTAHRHGLYWPEKPLVDRNTLASVSLGSLLASSVQQGPGRLSVADSRRLALALSVGVLRLHDTPWLARRWGRDDIVLFKQSNLILTQHPFVSADLHKVDQPPLSKSSPAIRNETLFALGIVLIELCMGQNFDLLHLPHDLNADGTKHAASDFLAANRLVDQIYDRAGKRYGDAVRRCILCEFDQRKTNLEDDDFRRAVYNNVVAVLEEDVTQFFGL